MQMASPMQRASPMQMAPPMHVGLLPTRGPRGMANLAARTEDLGFAGVWVADSQSIFRDAFATWR
jgi:5,10-methylenetetrahydromethanopterin reductase